MLYILIDLLGHFPNRILLSSINRQKSLTNYCLKNQLTLGIVVRLLLCDAQFPISQYGMSCSYTYLNNDYCA